MTMLKTSTTAGIWFFISTITLAQASAAPIQTEVKTGRFQTAFSIPSKLGTYGEMIERFAGEKGLRNLDANMAEDGLTIDKYEAFTVTLAEETYEVYVPPAYEPAKPIGIMVYIPARDSGSPHPQYLPVLDDRYMIYIAANLSGNRQSPILRRAPLALHALENMSRIYNIDPARVYASGLSGGGKMAVYLGLNYGDHFTGALFIIGSLSVSDRARMAPTGAVKKLVQTRNRYVFLTGRQDFNRKEIRRHRLAFRRFGIQNTLLIDDISLAHRPPPEKLILRAVRALDGLPEKK